VRRPRPVIRRPDVMTASASGTISARNVAPARQASHTCHVTAVTGVA